MYSARIDGEPTTFGTSGMLYRSNKVMYDRETNTLWSSLLGVPVIGPLARRDLKLEFFPVAFTTWGEWLAEHPDTAVLSRSTGYYSPRTYGPEESAETIYYSYRASADTMFPVWNRDGRLETKAEVLGLSMGDSHKAYPVSSLRALRVVNDRIADREGHLAEQSQLFEVVVQVGEEQLVPAGARAHVRDANAGGVNWIQRHGQIGELSD